MKRIFALAWIAALTMPVSVVAKGPTSRISIVDTVRGTSIEITDPTVLSRFKVWVGPGTYSRTNGQDTEGMDGFIVEPLEQLAYTVFYERDSSSGNGFVYLPGKSDEQYRLNVFSIHRGSGFEGHWFRANHEWEGTIGRLLRSH